MSDENWGKEPEAIWGILNTEVDGLNYRGKVESERGNYVKYYENVYDAITGAAPLEVMAEQARNTIRIIELAMQSNEQRRTILYN